MQAIVKYRYDMLKERMKMCPRETKTWCSLELLATNALIVGHGATLATRREATKYSTQQQMGIVTSGVLKYTNRRGWP